MRQYQDALQAHLKGGVQSRLLAAPRLGRRAVVLGLEVLDLAHMHKKALKSVAPAGGSSAARARTARHAAKFFSEAILPIEHTHRAEVASADRLQQKHQALRQRRVALGTARRHLKEEVLQRETAEQTLRKNDRHYARLLRESNTLQNHLRRLTHRILAAQEEGRQAISHTLHDEIAQTLLGIHVRVLTLKKCAAARTEVLAREIAGTQRLVKKSVQTIERFAHEFGIQNET